MALGVFAAGPYTSSVTSPGGSPAAAGLLQDGWVLEWAQLEEQLNKTDLYGRTLIEGFHQGLEVSLSAIFHEWKAVEVKLVTPHMLSTAFLPVGATNLDVGIMGAYATDQASALVLTALANTPAVAVGPASVTFTKVKQGQSPVQILFGPEHRTFPFRGDVYPYTRGGAQGGLSFLAAT